MMITMQDINKATLDETSTEDFEILLQEYYKQNPVSQDSKDRFKELVAKIQQSQI